MRANEFVIEGPVDKAGDWMQKQVIGRKQKDQAAAQKQNTPKVAKLIQQQIAAKFDAMIAKDKEHVKNNIDDILPKLVADVLKKAIRVSASNKDVYGDSIDQIVDNIKADPMNIETSNSLHGLLTDVITKSFGTEPSYSDTNEKLITALREKVKNMKPADARKFILDYAKKAGHNNKAANQIADEVLSDLEDLAQADELDQFVAEIFLIDGTYIKKEKGQQKAYANRDGKWSLWRMASSNLWEFMTSVADDTEDDAIETLIAEKGLQPIPATFSRKDNNYFKVES